MPQLSWLVVCDGHNGQWRLGTQLVYETISCNHLRAIQSLYMWAVSRWECFLWWGTDRSSCAPKADFASLLELGCNQGWTIVGQFGTGQFGTKIIKRTIWHQDNKSGQFGTKIIKVDNLAPGQFGTRTIWHRTIWHQDNLAPNI